MAEVMDWASLLLRWAHVMAGIGWIGTSFYFIWLDASLRRREGTGADMAGESWMVHGGGFYRVEKFLVAPKAMPKELHWFKPISPGSPGSCCLWSSIIGAPRPI